MGQQTSGVPVDELTIDPGQAHDGWPYTLPVVRQLRDTGLALAPGATVLLGPNGSGKSTCRNPRRRTPACTGPLAWG